MIYAPPLKTEDLAQIARRFEAAHARSDISALAILAVETIPALLADARLAAGLADRMKKDAAE